MRYNNVWNVFEYVLLLIYIGVGNPDGQIFILTTNFVDQLDDALIRSGRVDLHIQFPMATDEQLKDIFLLFYPDHEKESNEFVSVIRNNFEKGLSMASVQQHFIQTMFQPAKDVIDAVKDLGKRLDVVAELNEKTIVEEEDDDEDEKDENKDEEMTKDNVIEGLKESFKQLEELTKNNEEFGKLLESFVKSYNDECKKASKDKDKEKDDTKDEQDDKDDDKEKEKEKEKVESSS